jgi:ankyrin repeat protein
MKKQILMIVALSLTQGAFAMDPLPSHTHYESHAEDDATLAQVTSLDYQLYRAAEEGHYKEATRLLEEGATVNAVGDYDESALGAAARQGHEEVVKLLLRNHALIDAKDTDGATPLMRASTANIVELLLHAGADINAQDNEGRSVLHYAVASPNFYVIQSLLENGANIDCTDNTGITPILQAAGLGNEELVLLLLATPNRNMIESAFAGFNAIQKKQKPTKDIRFLLKKAFVAQLVEDQMNRIAPAISYNSGVISSLMNVQIGHINPNVVDLFGPDNNPAYARIRQRVEDNIRRLILNEPRQQPEPAQGLSQEEVDEIMGSWLSEKE